ncbi:MAG: hemerythrin family protein [Burkholderiales bacterium]|nr:hemerythrin family protein [Burkholderiales bacterium]
MKLLSWRASYQVGVDLIDTEHKYLFKLINEFHDSYAAGNTHKQLLLVLNRLVAYAEEHFQHEETLMQEIGYPRLARQEGMHQKLFSSIFELNEKLSVTDAKVDAETLRFLKYWMLEHILKEDMDIGDFMRRKAAQVEKAIGESAG